MLQLIIIQFVTLATDQPCTINFYSEHLPSIVVQTVLKLNFMFFFDKGNYLLVWQLNLNVYKV